MRITRLDPIFCAGEERRDRPNSNECNILANRGEKTPRSIRQINSLFATLISPSPDCRSFVVYPCPLWFIFFGFLFRTMKPIDRSRLQSLMQREQKKFVDERPKSKALFERARKSLLAGVPMNWMVKWAGAFPPFVREAQGAHFFDVDGHRYTDFCLGDTGAMTGHSPFATVKAAEEQMKRGITLMLPGEDAIIVAEELQNRFQLALLAIRADRDRRE